MTQDISEIISGDVLPNDVLLPWLWPFYMFQQFSSSKAIEEVTEKFVEDEKRSVSDVFAFICETLKISHGLDPVWSTPNKIKVDLPTMRLRDFSDAGIAQIPVVILAPYAGHSATIADYSLDQSLVQTLKQTGLSEIYITDWKSATSITWFCLGVRHSII